ncbi:MAG: ferrochelatase [Cyanobacteria bacterium P01_C01_bin.89]
MVVTASEHQNHNHAGSGDRVAILLMGYGEVESYEDFANYNEQALQLLTAKFAPVPTWIYPPLAKILALFDLHEWSHQHGNFISPHNQIFENQRAGIETHLQEKWGDRVKVFKAFNFCAPFLPDQVLKEIHREGFNHVLIYPLLVVDSIFTSGIALEQVNNALGAIARERWENSEMSEGDTVSNSDDVDGENSDGVAPPIKPLALQWPQGTRYIPSFYNEPDYIQFLADYVEQTIQNDLAVAHLPSQIGIVLMNHGCPHKAKGFTSGITESEALYEAVRVKLINRFPLISVGWLNHDTPLIEWTQPHAELAAKNLIDLGATAIVMMPIGFVTENHETLLDVEHIIESVRKKHPDITYRQLPCPNDHPTFLEMAANWANPHIDALLNPQPAVFNLGDHETYQTTVVYTPHSHGNGQGHSHGHDHSHGHAHGPKHHHGSHEHHHHGHP